MRTAAIIAAGGSGKRFGGETRKQYYRLSGKPVLAWTLYPFLHNEAVGHIIIVVPPEDVEFCKSSILPVWPLHKEVTVTGGGACRQESVRKGLSHVTVETDIVIVHDGARPFIKAAALDSGIDACAKYGAVIFAVPETDSIVEVDEHTITAGLDRERVWRVQTPQIFRREIIARAFEHAQRAGFEATDESALVRESGCGVRVMPGSYDNIKITMPRDIERAEYILSRNKELSMLAAQ